MIIGIPRALLYFKNEKFWTTLFDEIGVKYILSPETNKEILTKGTNLSIDESCLPTKLLLGHIDWLKDKCDYVFVPRIAFCHGYEMCTKFLGQTDLVRNTFAESDIKFLFYSVNKKKLNSEKKAIIKMGKFLGVKKAIMKQAYQTAKQAQQFFEIFREQNQENLLANTKKNKILLVAHAYNVGDKYVGEPVISTLKALNSEPIIAEFVSENKCIIKSLEVSKTLPWAYNRHLVGAIELLKDKVDGIILLTTFPCGPDSMVNEMIIRKFKDKPIITLTVDSQDGTAGMETRLESFIDIIDLKKEKNLWTQILLLVFLNGQIIQSLLNTFAKRVLKWNT